MNQHLDEAIERFRLQNGRYLKTERYYDGSHDLAFATDKFRNTFGTLFREFALNLCPAICDAIRDKLRIVGFSLDDIGMDADRALASDSRKLTRRIWNANRMRSRSVEIHKEALKNGDAYAIVWPDASGTATIYPNRADSCTVIYDAEVPGRIERAAKYWRTPDGRVRVNLFYPDRIERWVTKDGAEGTLTDAGNFAESEPAITNPYGVVPLFHFANNADLGLAGRSELESAIPIQDGLNKSVLDMLVAMEFSAFRQRWAAGIEIEYDAEGKAIIPFKAGVEHLWMSQNSETKFGDFDTSNLEQFLKVKDSFRVDMALVTGTPLHYFTPNLQGFHTGESLKKSETRFLAKVRDRQAAFGQVWADLMSFALAIEGRGHGIQLLTEWEDPAPMSEREVLENILLKKQIGLPVEQALLEAGYGAADVQRFVPEVAGKE